MISGDHEESPDRVNAEFSAQCLEPFSCCLCGFQVILVGPTKLGVIYEIAATDNNVDKPFLFEETLFECDPEFFIASVFGAEMEIRQVRDTGDPRRRWLGVVKDEIFVFRHMRRSPVRQHWPGYSKLPGIVAFDLRCDCDLIVGARRSIDRLGAVRQGAL